MLLVSLEGGVFVLDSPFYRTAEGRGCNPGAIMSRGAAADSFAAPRLIMFPMNTTAFSRVYTLTPLRGWIRDHSEFITPSLFSQLTSNPD